ncbi:MAG TPA: LysR family transcriptional regulator [Casimicrobiaceae bacterium]|nr:LysR family transcriptional regulator [Casimicrobiaceae bacterium]
MAMDLAAMEVFARVVEARSFSGAARRLEMSTSVVSKCVTRLEESLGVRLLNRTTRSISLTEIGREFYTRCSHIVAAADEAQALTAGMQAEPRGVLKVNVPVSFGILHIVPALGTLMSDYPGLAIDMTLSDREVHLAEEGYDVAVSIAGEPRGSLVARKLAPIRRRLCAAPGYLKRRRVPVTLDDLAHHDCIVHSLPGGERAWHFEGDDGITSVDVNGSLRFDNDNAIRKAALAGLGVALLPTYIVGDDIRDGRLRIVLPELEGPRLALFATYLPNRYLAAKVRVFVDYLVAMFGPEPQWDAQPRGTAATRALSPAASPAARAAR